VDDEDMILTIGAKIWKTSAQGDHGVRGRQGLGSTAKDDDIDFVS
jgi:hypothetical protein